MAVQRGFGGGETLAEEKWGVEGKWTGGVFAAGGRSGKNREKGSLGRPLSGAAFAAPRQ